LSIPFITFLFQIKPFKTRILLINLLIYISIYKYVYILTGIYWNCQAANSQRDNDN